MIQENARNVKSFFGKTEAVGADSFGEIGHSYSPNG